MPHGATPSVGKRLLFVDSPAGGSERGGLSVGGARSELVKMSKFLTGESLLDILDSMTRVFAQRMGDRRRPARRARAAAVAGSDPLQRGGVAGAGSASPRRSTGRTQSAVEWRKAPLPKPSA
jgi:hypothetical protein